MRTFVLVAEGNFVGMYRCSLLVNESKRKPKPRIIRYLTICLPFTILHNQVPFEDIDTLNTSHLIIWLSTSTIPIAKNKLLHNLMLRLMVLINARLSDYKEVAVVLVVELDVKDSGGLGRLVDLEVLPAFSAEVCYQVNADEVIFICGEDQVRVHLGHLYDAELLYECFLLKQFCQIDCLVLVQDELLGFLAVKVKPNLSSPRQYVVRALVLK